MRLNRVLLLAATINIMIFALVFTISCSDGADGKQGKAGDHCIVNEEDYTIYCNGIEKGTLLGGKGDKGKPGEPGANGAPGAPGAQCWVNKSDKDPEAWVVFCGKSEEDGELQGTLDGCSVTNGFSKFELNIVCGSTQISICGKEIFDPEEFRCDVSPSSGGDTLLKADDSPIKLCGPQQIEYDSRKQYCGFAETSVVADTVYTLCPNVKSMPGDRTPNDSSWNREYCRYLSEDSLTKSPAYCEDGKPINKGAWLKQYCGYASGTDPKTSLQTNRCDNDGYALFPNGEGPEGSRPGSGTGVPDTLFGVYGPNQAAYGQGYCTVTFENKDTKKTTYSEKLCGGKSKINEGSWKGEYCGFAAGSQFPDKVVKTEVCGDGTGVDSDTVGIYFCGFKDPFTKTTSRLRYCGQINYTTDSTGTVAKKTYNVKKWQGDYCGWARGSVGNANRLKLASRLTGGFEEGDTLIEYKTASANNVSKGILKGQQIAGACDTTSASYPYLDTMARPADSLVNITYCQFNYWGKSRAVVDTNLLVAPAKVLNYGVWKGQYMAKNMAGTTDSTAALGACAGDSSGTIAANRGFGFTGPHSKGWGKGYCAVSRTNDTAHVDTLCGGVGGGKPNPAIVASGNGTETNPYVYKFGGFKKDYCGYADTANTRKVFVGGECDLPFSGTSTYGAYANKWTVSSNDTTNGAWGGYCKAISKDSLQTRLSKDYCGTAVATRKPLNEGSWKNEYCDVNKVVFACPTNWTADTTLSSVRADFCQPPKTPKKSV